VFREFVSHSLSVESIHFFAWTEAYASLPSRGLRQSVAPLLLHLFLESDSKHLVNLSSTMVANLHKQIKSAQQFPSNLFADAQAEIIMLLTQNHWRPFQDTPAYRFCLVMLRPDAHASNSTHIHH
jgi:hypothetical protein